MPRARRSVPIVKLALWSLFALSACQSAPPSAPEAPAEPAGGLGLAANSCQGKPATHVLTPGGPGTDGTWFQGTDGKDVIVGTNQADKIDARSGADFVCSLGGADSVRGASGNDRLVGGPGDDWMDGEGDSDRLDGEKGNDRLLGGPGRDQLNGGAGEDVLVGGGQSDVLNGGADDDTLEGEAGQDKLRGNAGADALDGGDDVDDCEGGGQQGDTQTNCELFFVQLTAGYNHTCGLEADGTAWCWGEDSEGQLGDGSANPSTPIPVAVIGGHTFESLAAGYYYTCGVRTDGAAYCWGYDTYGVLGDGSAGASSATPAAVAGGHTFQSVAVGLDHTCGVRTDGAAYCWGKDDFGPLGDGTAGSPTLSASPVAVTGGHVFASIAVHRSVTCGVRTDGAAYCWGYDGNGVIGDGTVDSPQSNPTPVAVTGGHVFSSLAAGSDGNSYNHVCGVRTDGAAYCWGNDGDGELGDGTTGTPNANPAPDPVTGGHTFASLAANQYFTCGVRTDGAAYCWGDDSEGELGDGTAGGSRPTPAAVTGGHTFDSLAAGFNHACGLLADGTALCWGDDGSGQLGDGTIGPNRATPAPVVSP